MHLVRNGLEQLIGVNLAAHVPFLGNCLDGQDGRTTGEDLQQIGRTVVQPGSARGAGVSGAAHQVDSAARNGAWSAHVTGSLVAKRRSCEGPSVAGGVASAGVC